MKIKSGSDWSIDLYSGGDWTDIEEQLGNRGLGFLGGYRGVGVEIA